MDFKGKAKWDAWNGKKGSCIIFRHIAKINQVFFFAVIIIIIIIIMVIAKWLHASYFPLSFELVKSFTVTKAHMAGTYLSKFSQICALF